MGLTAVNVRAFDDLQKKMQLLAKERLLPVLAKRMAATAIKQLTDEFRESRNPYGEQWAPVRRDRARDRRARRRRAQRQAAGLRVRADKPLIDSGRLRAAAIAQAADQSTTDAVRIVIPVEYASYHQTGTRRIQQRQIVPDSAGGLGPIWGKAMNDEANRVLAQIVRQK